jgi:hypothetical protein
MLKRNESNAKKYRNAPPSTCHQAWNIYSAFHLLHLHFFDKPHFLKYTFKNVFASTSLMILKPLLNILTRNKMKFINSFEKIMQV